MYKLNHIHMKSNDPMKAAEWWVANFGFEIIADMTRDTGDRFVKCQSHNGIPVNISGPLRRPNTSRERFRSKSWA